jgi:hypothetical protein
MHGIGSAAGRRPESAVEEHQAAVRGARPGPRQAALVCDVGGDGEPLVVVVVRAVVVLPVVVVLAVVRGRRPHPTRAQSVLRAMAQADGRVAGSPGG